MNRQRAQQVLARYRPGKDPATDPEVAAALALVEQDPELARWFEHDQAMDAALRRKLQGIPVPSGLEARILAARPMRIARPARWWATSLLPAAAAILVVFGASAVWLAPWKSTAWVDYQSTMVHDVTHPYTLDIETRSQAQVRESMAAAGFPSDYRVPAGLVDYPLEGGLKLLWRDRKVSVACFGSDEEHKPDVWLIISSRSALSGAPATTTPEYGAIGRVRIARWADEGHFYIVATEDGPDLKGLF